MDWRFAYAGEPQRVAMLVSREDHCLLDLLWRWRRGELEGEIVAGRLQPPRPRARRSSGFGVPYHHVPVEPRRASPRPRQRLLELLRASVDAARPRPLHADPLAATSSSALGVPGDQHPPLFLPAFAGADPYRRAHERGVKLIGATAHYVTEELDAGPIIEQDVHRVSHADEVADLGAWAATSSAPCWRARCAGTSRTACSSTERARSCSDARKLRSHATHRRTGPARCARRRAGSRSPSTATRSTRDPRRPRRRVQPRLHLPEGLDAQAAARGPRPAAHAAGPPRRRARAEATLGRGVRRRSSARLDADHRRSTAATRSAIYLGNPNAHNLAGAALRPRARCRRSAPATSTRRAPSTRCRSRSSAALMFGGVADDPGARPRPHRLPADARRQPVRVERQPMHRARLARPARGDPRARRHGSWWSTRGARRTAEEADEHVAIRPGTDALPAARARARAVRRGPRRPRRRSPSTSSGLDEVACARRRLHARGASPPACGIDADDDPPARARARRRADAPRVYGRIGTMHAGVRHARLAGWSTSSTSSPATSTGPAARCSPRAAAGAAQHAAAPGRRPRRAARPPRTAGCAGLPETLRRAARRLPGRGDRDARATGQVRALVTHRRQPGAVDARTAAGSTRALASLDFMVSVDIYLNETTRHADVILPAPVAARSGPLRPRASTSSRSATSPTTRRRCSPLEPGAARRVGDPAAAGADRRRPGRRRRPGASSTTCVIARLAGEARRRRALAGRTAATPTSCWRRSAAARGPERLLDFMLRTGPYGDGFGAARRADARRARGQPARHRPRPARSRGCPRCCARRAGMIELAPAADRRRRRPAARPRWTRPRNGGLVLVGRRAPAVEQLVDAQRRGAGEGQASAARCTSTPTTRRGSASPTARRARVRRPRGVDRRSPVEVTDAIMPGVV